MASCKWQHEAIRQGDIPHVKVAKSAELPRVAAAHPYILGKLNIQSEIGRLRIHRVGQGREARGFANESLDANNRLKTARERGNRVRACQSKCPFQPVTMRLRRMGVFGPD